jgi:hypothetical protein
VSFDDEQIIIPLHNRKEKCKKIRRKRKCERKDEGAIKRFKERKMRQSE